MPHVIVKLYPGRSEQQKSHLTREIVNDVVAIAKCGEESVSVAIEEIKPRLDREGLQAGYSGKAGETLQETRIRPV
jgi:phenylpyruvate tautomerase PptA (4-oxalocrotonate tautomerase family)